MKRWLDLQIGTRLDAAAILALGETSKRVTASACGAIAMAERLAETARMTVSTEAAERYGPLLSEVQARVCELGEVQAAIQQRLSQLHLKVDLLFSIAEYGSIVPCDEAPGRVSAILDLETERLRRMPPSEAVTVVSAIVKAGCALLDADVAETEAALTDLCPSPIAPMDKEVTNKVAESAPSLPPINDRGRPGERERSNGVQAANCDPGGIFENL